MLPAGYSFNLDDTSIHMAIAVFVIARWDGAFDRGKFDDSLREMAAGSDRT